jgi:hypothetical protein
MRFLTIHWNQMYIQRWQCRQFDRFRSENNASIRRKMQFCKSPESKAHRNVAYHPARETLFQCMTTYQNMGHEKNIIISQFKNVKKKTKGIFRRMYHTRFVFILMIKYMYFMSFLCDFFRKVSSCEYKVANGLWIHV